MKQYCRYCGYLAAGSRIWCSRIKEEISREAACSPNRCGNFAYHPVDAFAGDKEIPHGTSNDGKKTVQDQCEGQISLFK